MHRYLGLLPALVIVGGASLLASPVEAPRTPLRLPADRVFKHSPEAPAPVVFRHATHVVLEKWKCLTCHPQVFKLLSRELRPTHAEMDAGRQCGLCHNGRRAFATNGEACATCHSERTGGDPFARSIVLTHTEAPAPVPFPHARHAAALGSCSACHPALFPQQLTGRHYAKTALVAGEACGQCHNGKQALSVEDERCDACHKEAQP